MNRLANKIIASDAAVVLAAAVLALAASGCFGTYGRVKLDPDMAGRFVSGQLPADYHYYYTGRENAPYAIVGIRPEYKFVARFWTPVAPNTEAFRKMARSAWTTPNHDRPVAGRLLSPEGRDIGLWYSYDPHATVKMQGANAVAVYSPYKSESWFQDAD